MKSAESTLTKKLALVGLVVVMASGVIGINIYATDMTRQDTAVQASTTNIQPLAAAASTANAVLGTQTQKSSGYDVKITSVKRSNQLQIGVTVTNTSDKTLQLSPGLQFNIVSTASRQVQDLLPTAVMTGGPLAPGASTSGVLTFATPPAADQFELRFYPDVTGTDYVVLSLASFN